MPPTQSLSPMPPLAIRAYTATTALGRGRAAQAAALRERRGGLRRNDFGDAALDTWIGRVDGLEDAPLPPAFAQWEYRHPIGLASVNPGGLHHPHSLTTRQFRLPKVNGMHVRQPTPPARI